MRYLLLLLPLLLVGCGTEKIVAPDPRPTEAGPAISVRGTTGLVQSPDGKASFVLQEDGKIFRVDGQQLTTWLDVSSRIGAGGLQALAFSPQWESDRLFYIFFRNKGGATVLLEGTEEGERGSVRRTVFRFYDTEALPGPMIFSGQTLILGVRGKSSRKGWPGSLLRIEPFLKTGQAYSIPPDNADGEVWRRGFGDITSLATSDDRLWITSGQKLLRTSLRDPRPTSPEKTLPCLRGGAPWLNTFYYGSSCSGEIFSWPSGQTVGTVRGLRGLVATDARVLALAEDGVYSLPGEK